MAQNYNCSKTAKITAAQSSNKINFWALLTIVTPGLN
jgi:hypothetical protein